MLDLLLYAVAFVLVALLGGNALPACTGTLIAGRILSKNQGVGIAVAGYIIGFIAQGGFLGHGFALLLPGSSQLLVLVAMTSALIVFLIAHFLRVPISFAIVFTTAIIGIDLASHQALNTGFIGMIFIYWIAAVVISALLVLVSLRYSEKLVKGRRIWPLIRVIKVLLLMASFLTAFTLGSNTMGLVYAAVASVAPVSQIYLIAFMVLAMSFGSIALSGGVLSRIGSEIIPMRYLNAVVTQSVAIVLVELATLSSLPISTTQTFTAGVYGAGLSYRTRVLLRGPFISIVGTWFATAVISLVLGFALASLLA